MDIHFVPETFEHHLTFSVYMYVILKPITSNFILKVSSPNIYGTLYEVLT